MSTADTTNGLSDLSFTSHSAALCTYIGIEDTDPITRNKTDIPKSVVSVMKVIVGRSMVVVVAVLERKGETGSSISGMSTT